jgi:hypothetical protein
MMEDALSPVIHDFPADICVLISVILIMTKGFTLKLYAKSSAQSSAIRDTGVRKGAMKIVAIVKRMWKKSSLVVVTTNKYPVTLMPIRSSVKNLALKLFHVITNAGRSVVSHTLLNARSL